MITTVWERITLHTRATEIGKKIEVHPYFNSKVLYIGTGFEN